MNIPSELHAMILAHVNADVHTVVAFACAHNLLAEPALKRICKMLAEDSWGTWADDRITTVLDSFDDHPDASKSDMHRKAERHAREVVGASLENPFEVLSSWMMMMIGGEEDAGTERGDHFANGKTKLRNTVRAFLNAAASTTALAQTGLLTAFAPSDTWGLSGTRTFR